MRLPWAHPPGGRRRGRGHGRTEFRSIKVLDLDGTPAQALFPHARRAIKVVRRRRVGAGKPSVEIVYAITSLDYRAADPPCSPTGCRATGRSRTASTTSAT